MRNEGKTAAEWGDYSSTYRALSRDAEKTPAFSCFHILRDIPPRRRVLDVQDGIGFRPLLAKDFCDGGGTALKSCGRIGTNGASGSATNENDPFCGGFSGFGQTKRAEGPPRGTGISGGKSPEPPCEPHPSSG